MTSIQQQCDAMLRRSVALQGQGLRVDPATGAITKDSIMAVTKEFITQLCSVTPDPLKQAEILAAAYRGGKDSEAMQSLNRLRIEQVGNFIAVESMWGSAFFVIETLGEDEEPAVWNEAQHEVRVGHIGEDGRPDEVKILRETAKYTIALRLIASDVIKYKIRDLYRGQIAELAQKTIDISRDLTFKLDREHFNLLNASVANGGCFGAFSFENSRTNKARRIYLPHSGIKTVHLPPTNDYDMTGNALTSTNPARVGNTTYFGIKVLQAVVDYCDRWGNVLPGGGRLQPTGEIIVPASDISAIAADATPTSDTPSEEVIQQQVNQNGYTSLTYLGRTWKFIGDLTIDKGTCYPRFNLLPGTSFRKPSWDSEDVETNKRENWEKRWMQKCYAAHIISQRRPRAMRIKFAN